MVSDLQMKKALQYEVLFNLRIKETNYLAAGAFSSVLAGAAFLSNFLSALASAADFASVVALASEAGLAASAAYAPSAIKPDNKTTNNLLI